MEESLGGRHREQRTDFACATRLAHDRYVIRVAAEGRDVVAHPLQRGHYIQNPGVRRADLRKVKETKRVETMVDAEHHDIVLPRHVRAVVHRVAAVAAGESAAVQPDHHWTLCIAIEARGPCLLYT